MSDVILRPIQEGDLDDLCRYVTDPNAGGEFEWTGFKDPYLDSGLTWWFARSARVHHGSRGWV